MNKLMIEYLPISKLKPYKNNPRFNEEAVPKVAESIKEYGWRVPVIIDSNNIIVAGHTRYKAAKMLGIESIPCIIIDDLSEEQIKAYRIADNKAQDFSIWDNKLLLEELDGLEEYFTGFEFSDTFDILDENDDSVIANNEEGFVYEYVIKSQDKTKIDKIRSIWEGMSDE